MSNDADNKLVDLIHRYFRRADSKLIESELEKFSKMEKSAQFDYIRNCQYPDVLDKLLRIGDREIQNAVYRTKYYKELGQFKDVLQFSVEERLQFAAFDSYKNLYVLLLFDTEIEVIKACLYNHSVSIPLLKELYRILEHRKFLAVDDVFLRMIEEAIEHKEKVQKKASKIESSKRNLSNPDKLANILIHLLDEDEEVILFTLYALSEADFNVFNEVVKNYDIVPDEGEQKNNLSYLRLEIRIKEIFSGEYQFKQFIPEEESFNEDSIFLGKPYSQIKRDLDSLFQKKKEAVLKACERDAAHLDNILSLLYLVTDKSGKYRKRAEAILSLDDIFELMSESDTPRDFIKEGLGLLSKLQTPEIEEKIKEIYFKESERLWAKLKEMEVSTNAYFDLIFQSMNFQQITGTKALRNRIREDRKIMDGMLRDNDGGNAELRSQLKTGFEKVDQLFEEQIHVFYTELNDHTYMELDEVHGILEQVSLLSRFEKNSSEGFAIKPGDEERVAKKVHAIWRSAISIYLGRLKELNDILKSKFENLAKSDSVISIDFQRVLSMVDALEENHKREVKCMLPIRCRECTKRGCSSERFLRESLLWAGELIKNRR